MYALRISLLEVSEERNCRHNLEAPNSSKGGIGIRFTGNRGTKSVDMGGDLFLLPDSWKKFFSGRGGKAHVYLSVYWLNLFPVNKELLIGCPFFSAFFTSRYCGSLDSFPETCLGTLRGSLWVLTYKPFAVSGDTCCEELLFQNSALVMHGDSLQIAKMVL